MLTDLTITSNESGKVIPLREKKDVVTLLAPFYLEHESSKPKTISLDTTMFESLCESLRSKATKFYLWNNEIITHIIKSV